MNISKFSETIKHIMDIAYEGVIVVDEKGVITMVNEVFAEFFGRKPEEMIGKYVSDAYCNPQLSRLPVVLRTGEAEVGRFFTLHGRQVIISRFPIFEQGKIIGAIGKILFRELDVLDEIVRKTSIRSGGIREGDTVVSQTSGFKQFIGNSQIIMDLKETINKIAVRNSTVLIRGESGTGKELLANAIHTKSNRRFAPLIKVNCAAIPENLLESELFGYADGAFTGAKKGGQLGKFELANKGTIFLDEIGDMPLTMQAKLLRVLQEKEVQPLGGAQPRQIDVRIIAATNVTLEALIKAGKFREDLYYRLNVVNLNIPSLRERKEDIRLLTEYFIQKYNQEFGLNITNIQPEVIAVFLNHSWPGNIRELENVIERIFNIIEGDVININHLPQYMLKYGKADETVGQNLQNDCKSFEKENSGPQGILPNSVNVGTDTLNDIMERMEKEIIIQTLNLCKGNKVQAANMLGVSRPGLYKKIDKYGLA